MARNLKMNSQKHSLISIILVMGITVLALLVGWFIKDSSENNTTLIARGGVEAYVPRGWLTQYGVEGESWIFSASDPFDVNHIYSVSQMPIVPGGQLTDSVVTRNLQRAQEITNYQVLDQNSVKLGNSDGFRVTYAYVTTPKFSKIPLVIRGVDFYQFTQNRVIVITFENQSYTYEQVYPTFIRFLNSVSIKSGG